MTMADLGSRTDITSSRRPPENPTTPTTLVDTTDASTQVYRPEETNNNGNERQQPRNDRNDRNDRNGDGSWGHPCTDVVEGHLFRVLFKNINGIGTTYGEQAHNLDELRKLNPSLLGIAEHRLNLTNYRGTVMPLMRRIRRTWNAVKMIFDDCKDESLKDVRSKPGGVLQLCIGGMSSRVQDTIKDPTGMGRWVGQKMISATGEKAAVITCYRVCQPNPTKVGLTTAAMQQWRVMTEAGYNHANPREQVLLDLESTITELQEEDYAVLLMIDANGDLETDKSLKRFVDDVLLFDMHPATEGDGPPPPSLRRGSKKIDYVFGCAKFMEALKRRGCLSFEQSLGDHRGLFADFDIRILFGSTIVDPTNASNRRLTSTAPDRVEKYLTCLLKLMRIKNIIQRLRNLYKKCDRQGYATRNDHKTFEGIDRDMTAAMLKAERKCGKANYGHPWSPELMEAGREYRRVKSILSSLKNKRGIPSNQQEQHKQDVLHWGKETQAAYQYLKKIQKKAPELRIHSLYESIENPPEDDEETQEEMEKREKEIHQLLHREQVRNMFQKIGRFLGTNERSSLDRVLVPDLDSTEENAYKELTEPAEVFAALYSQGQKELGAAKSSPLAQDPWTEILPPWTYNEVSEALVRGEYEFPAEIPDAVKIALEAVKCKDGVMPEDLPIELELGDFKEAIRIKRESTASSPSGRHIGHYKTALKLKDPKTGDDDDTITEVHLGIVNFARRFTSPPSRWFNAIQLRLEKIPGEPYIDKLRMIVLMEFDMNLQFGLTIGRQMVWQAEETGQYDGIPQYSGPGKSATSAALLKRTTCDIARQYKQDLIGLNNDQAHCYDRLIPAVGGLSIRKYGVPYLLIILRLMVLSNIRYFTRTAFGIGPQYYGNVDARSHNAVHPLEHDKTSRPRYITNSTTTTQNSTQETTQDTTTQDTSTQVRTTQDTSTKNYPRYINSSKNYPRYINSSKNYPRYTNSSKNYPRYINSSKNYPRYINSSKNYPRYINSSKNYPRYINSSKNNSRYINSSKNNDGYKIQEQQNR